MNCEADHAVQRELGADKGMNTFSLSTPFTSSEKMSKCKGSYLPTSGHY